MPFGSFINLPCILSNRFANTNLLIKWNESEMLYNRLFGKKEIFMTEERKLEGLGG